MNFSLSLYLFHHEDEGNNIDKFYRQLDYKSNWLLENTNNTANLYAAEYENKKKKIEESYADPLKTAYDNYNAAVDAIEDKTQQSLENAYHFSRIGDIESQIAYEMEELALHFEDINDLFYKSALTNLYTVLESSTKKLCDELHVTFETASKYQDLPGKNYFKKGLTFLIDHIGLDIDLTESTIKILEDLQFIRNKIIHNQGIFPEPITKIEGILLPFQGMASLVKDQEENNQLVITHIDFISFYFKATKTFFQNTIWQTNKRMDNKILNIRLMRMFRYVYAAIETTITYNEMEGDIRVIKGELMSQDQIQMKDFDFEFIILEQESRSMEVNCSFQDELSGNFMILLSEFEINQRIAFSLLFSGFYLTGFNAKISLNMFFKT